MTPQLHVALASQKVYEFVTVPHGLNSERSYLLSSEVPGAHMVCPSLSVAVSNLQAPPLSEKIESVFILGGSSVYAVSQSE